MTTAQMAPTTGVLPAFADSPKMRLFLGAILYLAQGFPQGLLFYGMAAWLAASGQSAGVVGSVIAAVALPWSFKFFLGAVLDRYTFLAMGRRRGWLVGAQFGIIASMLLFGVIDPAVENIALITAFAFIMSLLTATQDVALDAMVIDLTPATEMGNVNGFMYGGKIIGISLGTAATGYLSEFYGFNIALFAMAGLFAIPAIFALLVRERQGEKLLPWTSGKTAQENLELAIPAWLPIFITTVKSMIRRDPLVVVFLAFTYGVAQVSSETLWPVLSTDVLGWGESKFTSLFGVTGLIIAPLAFFAGGQIIDRFGPKLIAMLMSLTVAAMLTSYAMMQASWPDETVFYVMFIGAGGFGNLAYLTMLVLMMRVADPKVAATSFTLMTSAHAMGLALGGNLIGGIEEYGGYQAIMLFAAIMITLSGLSSLFLSKVAGGVNRQT